MKKQRIIGILLIIMSIAIFLLASTGTTPEEQDITVVLLLLPLGIYSLITKNYILNIPLEPERKKKQKSQLSKADFSDARQSKQA